MHTTPKNASEKQLRTSGKSVCTTTGGTLLHCLAFDYSLQPSIISAVSSGEIIISNTAASKLLNYSKKALLNKSWPAIFDVNESSFKKMLKQRQAGGRSTALVTAIKKSGKSILCEITSAVFMDEDGIEKAITTLTDMSEGILKQKNIDAKKVKVVAHNIALAKLKQKEIDTEKEKVVADNIILALAKSNGEKLEREIRVKEKRGQEIKLKERQIADATKDAKDTERSDIGKELHDNVNQLLSASRMYLDMAKQGGENSKMYLTRSSEYTVMAIEEIRKLTKGLTTDVIKNLGLCVAIDNVTRDTMETNPVKISCALGRFSEHSVNDKFKLNVFRIVQEQLNNILKHAKATKVAINLLQNKKSIMLTISDNGVGFDTGKKRIGIGVANIKSRATSYNGTADFVSQPGKGCVLNVTFPITNALLNIRGKVPYALQD